MKSRKFMENKRKKWNSLIAGVLCFTLLGAGSPSGVFASTDTEEDGYQAIMDGIMSPSDLALPSMEEYDVPFLGLTAALPQSLLDRMERKEIAMLTNDVSTEDGSSLKYGYLSWCTMTEEQWNTDINMLETDYSDWEKSLDHIGTLGVYQTDLVNQLNELTGCDEHLELGQSPDNAYKYYLSTNTKADKELTAELGQIQTTLTEIEKDTGEDAPQSDFTGTSLGEFTTQDIHGKTCTQELFRDYDLTMVNIFTTWCSPCVAEIPDLEKLHQEMADRDINVVGVVMDILDEKGEINQEALEKAKLLAEKTGATYPFLIPDTTYMNGRLTGIEAFPETFFVDKNGNIVGKTYSGSENLESWKAVVEKELANLKETSAS